MAKRRVKVTTEVGIQAKPATEFTETAGESDAEVTVTKVGGDSADAKSILQVLVLDVRSNDEIIIESDDQDVLARLVGLITGPKKSEVEVIRLLDDGDADDEE